MKLRLLSAIVVLVFFLPGIALSSSVTTSSAAQSDSGIQGQANEQNSPTRPDQNQHAYALTPSQYKKAVEYSRAQYRLYFIDSFWGFLILIAILGWRIGAKFRNWAEKVSARSFVQLMTFVPLLVITLGVLELPISVFDHWLGRKYEQSVQGWGSWLVDWSKSQLIVIVLGFVVAWILLGIIRRSTRRWWFYFWLASVPIVVFLLFVTPVVIDPLFFRFEPLQQKDPVLVDQLEKVTQRGGLSIPPDRMFQMDASEKLKSVNAYVTGVGPSKRVVVWDTTIEKMSIPETMFTFGHEMGHYVLDHVWKGIAFACVVMFVLFYFGFRLVNAALNRWAGRWSIRSVSDLAALPLLLLVISALAFLASPAFNAFSRHLEHQADVYGLEVTHGLIPNSADIAESAFQKIGELDLADPNPSEFIKFWLYSHPPMKERIVFARDYHPWDEGKQGKYVK